MASLWRQLDLEATHEEVLAIMQKYDTDGNGQLELGEFTVLVQELHAFQQSVAEKEFLAAAPALPLRVLLDERSDRAVGAMVAASAAVGSIASAETNVAKGSDLKYAELPLTSAEDGGILGFVTVSIKSAASVRPFLAVRQAFVRMDTDGDGILKLDECLPALRQVYIHTAPHRLAKAALWSFAACLRSHRPLCLPAFARCVRSG